MDSILVKDIMTPKPIAIDIDSPFSRVEEFFETHQIRHLPVVDDKNVLQGIITQRDLYRINPPRKTMDGDWVYSKEDLDRIILKHVMTRNPLALAPADTLAKVIAVMVTTKYGCLPVVDKDKKIVGIITHIDVLRAIYRKQK